MKVHDLSALMAGLPDMPDDDGKAMFRAPGSFNGGHARAGRYKGGSPWTCHPEGEAFLFTVSRVRRCH